MLKTEGIVLSEIRYKETSKILTVYTKKYGKISVMAQGAYKPKSRLIASTQPFSYSEFQLQKGKSFYYLSQADLIDSFYTIRESMERIIFGFYILELIEKSTPDEEENEKLFLLLEKGLKYLSKQVENNLKFIVAYELKYISFLGYRPFLNACVVCNRNLVSNYRFSIILGGAICESCTSEDLKSKKINHNFLLGINELLYTSLDDIQSIDIENNTLLKIHDVLLEYILFNIDRSEFKSLSLLKEIL